MSKVMRRVVLGGGVVILVLFLLVLYVSSKVKGELEKNLSAYAGSVSKSYSGEINTIEGDQSAKLDIPPFKCKGLFGYTCKSHVIFSRDGQEKFGIRDLELDFKDIRTDSMKFDVSGKFTLSDPNLLDFPKELAFDGFKITSLQKVVSQQDGRIESKANLSLYSQHYTINLETLLFAQSLQLANKNIIKIVQELFFQNESHSGLVYQMPYCKLTSKSENFKAAFLQYSQMPSSEYDKRVDESVALTSLLVGILGFRDVNNLSAVSELSSGYAQLFKSQAHQVSLLLRAKNQKSFALQNTDDLTKFLQDLDKNYTLSTQIVKKSPLKQNESQQ